MVTMRRMTSNEIEKFANRPGVRKIAVENFLMSMGDNIYNAIGNVYLDAKSYEWNKETIRAILEGIWFASRLEERDTIII